MTSGSNLPERPQLRPVEVSRISREGSDFFLLKDPRQLSDQPLLVPVPLAPYLQNIDGTNTVEEIVEAALSAGGQPVPPEIIDDLLNRLDDMLLLENGAFVGEMQRRLAEYRDAPSRKPALAEQAYPENVDDLRGYLDGFAFPYMNAGGELRDSVAGDLKAVISPHIDFERGGDSYGMIWEQVRGQLQDVELFVVFGTDHNGDGPRLTLTNQNYETPLGVLETDMGLVDELARILATDDGIDDHPFVDEMNHVNEHSIELATVWLHRMLGRSNAKMLPVLCGSMGRSLIDGSPDLDDHPQINAAIQVLKRVASERRTVFIAAADLAHVGPAFGDPELIPTESKHRKRVQNADENLLEAITSGDRKQFFDLIKSEADQNKICGLAPIYMTLWASDATSGNWNGYQQCQADEANTSFVSIAGAALY
ncbi:MAG TPA: AmmeMemoRadiSam system protein B [Dehalococcoidia bacterium]|jgi:AmmeMemoRadiSam system protein B|nr:AmmeMemoRadiSam system protein B [Dehalococcoidia bacterium]HIK89466.1 AmmeMemoRadiSam system protein B [Dehalococcoidia bacterium]